MLIVGIAKCISDRFFVGILGVIGNILTLLILCSSTVLRNKTFNMFLISQSALDFICTVIVIATAWDPVWADQKRFFGITGELC